MTSYRYDFELHTLNELPINDARLFLNIIMNNALTKAQAIQYKDNTVFVISEEQYRKLINYWFANFLNKCVFSANNLFELS